MKSLSEENWAKHLLAEEALLRFVPVGYSISSVLLFHAIQTLDKQTHNGDILRGAYWSLCKDGRLVRTEHGVTRGQP